MNKAQLDNQTKGQRPTLHAEEPDLDTLKGLVERATDGINDAKNNANSASTRFNAAYSAAFCLARVALEACGYRISPRAPKQDVCSLECNLPIAAIAPVSVKGATGHQTGPSPAFQSPCVRETCAATDRADRT
jgi:hypothetical protein